MSENDTAPIPTPSSDGRQDTSVMTQPPVQPPPGTYVADPTPATPGWKQRAYGARSVIAVAVAGVVLGGLGGAALGYAAHDDSSGFGGGRGGFGGPGGRQFPGAPGQQQGNQQGAPGQQQGAPGGFPGQPGQQGAPQGQGLPGQQGGKAPALPPQVTPSTAPTDPASPS